MVEREYCAWIPSRGAQRGKRCQIRVKPDEKYCKKHRDVIKKRLRTDLPIPDASELPPPPSTVVEETLDNQSVFDEEPEYEEPLYEEPLYEEPDSDEESPELAPVRQPQKLKTNPLTITLPTYVPPGGLRRPPMPKPKKNKQPESEVDDMSETCSSLGEYDQMPPPQPTDADEAQLLRLYTTFPQLQSLVPLESRPDDCSAKDWYTHCHKELTAEVSLVKFGYEQGTNAMEYFGCKHGFRVQGLTAHLMGQQEVNMCLDLIQLEMRDALGDMPAWQKLAGITVMAASALHQQNSRLTADEYKQVTQPNTPSPDDAGPPFDE